MADRGGEGDVLDFNWLLEKVVITGQLLSWVDGDELAWLCRAVESCLGRAGLFVVAGLVIKTD